MKMATKVVLNCCSFGAGFASEQRGELRKLKAVVQNAKFWSEALIHKSK